MRTCIAGLTAAMLLGHASASHHHHNHLHFHKHRAAGGEAPAVYVTSVVTVVPEAVYSSSSVEAPEHAPTYGVCSYKVYTSIGSYEPVLPTYESTSETPTPSVYSSTPPPAPVYTSTSHTRPPHKPSPVSSYVAPEPSTTTSSAPASTYVPPAASSSSVPAPSTGGGGSYAPINANGDQWCMAYTPYANDGGCTPTSQIYSDIADIASKGFTTIRIYSTDCGTFSAVAPACKQYGINMVLGVFVDSSGIGAAQSQVQDILDFGDWGMVEMIVVGNEAIASGYASAGDLAGFVASSKASFRSAGFGGPVTTTEPPGTMEQYMSTLCPVIDVVGSNIHPYFDPNSNALLAGAYVSSTITTLGGMCPGKEVYNLETGWPNQGQPDGLAIANVAEQVIAIGAIKLAAGSRSSFFTYTDDMWKAPGPFDAEQFWGCIQLF